MGIKERRDRERTETRQRILDVARELFAQEGFEAVSMRRIADAIEYSPTAIYQYFTDKEALFREICEQDFLDLAGAFATIAGEADPVRRLGRIAEAYVQFGIEHPNHYRLMFMTPVPFAMTKDEHDIEHGNPDQDAYAFLRHTIEDALAAGRFRTNFADADAIAQILWAATHGLVALHITKGGEDWIEWKAIADSTRLMVDALLHGLLRPEEAVRYALPSGLAGASVANEASAATAPATPTKAR